MAVYYFFKQNLLASLSIQLEIVAFDVINMFNRQASFEGLCFYFSVFQSYMKAFLVKFKTVFFFRFYSIPAPICCFKKYLWWPVHIWRFDEVVVMTVTGMHRYKQMKTLGDGTYGSVVLGKAYDTGETVAIKKWGTFVLWECFHVWYTFDFS